MFWLTYSTLISLFFEFFLKNEYKFTSYKEQPIILDLWANIWIATIYFKRLYPNCEIHSFEPDITHYNILKKNILYNKFINVFIYNKAVTNYNWEIKFYTDNKAWFGMSTKKWRMSKIETNVECISISNFIWEKNIDLLKMDIEWWEMDVLIDLEKSWKINQINEMIIEYHHNIPKDTMKFWNFLKIIENNWFTYQLNWYIFPLDAKNKFQDILLHAYKENV
jgi:FkbM family methyltransferase